MAILTADIVYRGSVAAAAGDATAQANPNLWLGDQVSTTAFVDAVLGNLFDDVSGDEAAAGRVEYRCVFVLNNHATLTLVAPKLWLVSEVALGGVIAIGLDPTGKSAKGAGVAQAVSVVDEVTAPAGVAFTAPTTKATGLALPDLAPAEVHAWWFRRTVAAATAALNADGVDWRVEGDSAA